jgi:hypothetical protein
MLTNQAGPLSLVLNRKVSMPRKPTGNKRTTSVNFEEGVLAYLQHLSEVEDRSCSYVVNKILKEDAERRGISIPELMADPHQGQVGG